MFYCRWYGPGSRRLIKVGQSCNFCRLFRGPLWRNRCALGIDDGTYSGKRIPGCDSYICCNKIKCDEHSSMKQFSVISAKIVSFFQFLRNCLANYECSWPQITFTEQLFVYSLPDRICMVIQIMRYLILPRTNIMSIGVRFYKCCGIRYQCLTW